MVSTAAFRTLALALPEATEQPHFEKPSFRVGKKIFATLDVAQSQACLKLSVAEQDVFCTYDRSIIYPVPNKWGLQGWTIIELKRAPKDFLQDALTTAYCGIAPKRLAVLVRPADGGQPL